MLQLLELLISFQIECINELLSCFLRILHFPSHSNLLRNQVVSIKLVDTECHRSEYSTLPPIYKLFRLEMIRKFLPEFRHFRIDHDLAVWLRGMLIIVVLMVSLCYPEGFGRAKLRDDRFFVCLIVIQRSDHLLCCSFLCIICKENDRTVLLACVTSLSVKRRRIVTGKKHTE